MRRYECKHMHACTHAAIATATAAAEDISSTLVGLWLDILSVQPDHCAYILICSRESISMIHINKQISFADDTKSWKKHIYYTVIACLLRVQCEQTLEDEPTAQQGTRKYAKNTKNDKKNKGERNEKYWKKNARCEKCTSTREWFHVCERACSSVFICYQCVFCAFNGTNRAL